MKFVKEFRFWKKQNLKEKLSLGLPNLQQYIKINKRFIYIKNSNLNLKRKDNLLKNFHQLSIEIIKNQSKEKIRINKNLKENPNYKI